jgi:hypothetical protein
LFGVFTMIARVFAEKAPRSSSRSKVQSGGRIFTKRGTAPESTASGP